MRIGRLSFFNCPMPIRYSQQVTGQENRVRLLGFDHSGQPIVDL